MLMLLAVAAPGRAASPPSIDIVIPAESPAYLDFAKAIHHNLLLLDDDLSVRIVTSTALDSQLTQQPPADLAIPVGDRLLPWAAANSSHYPHVLAFYVSSTAFRALGAAPHLSALFRDQPLSRQLALTRLLLTDVRSAVMLADGGSPPLATLQAVRAGGLELAMVDVRETAWPASLSRDLRFADVLLAHDDPSLYNQRTARSILLTSYRHGKAVVGPNQAFVQAGSLASVYTSYDQYLRQLSQAVAAFLRNGSLPPAHYPREFRVAINRQVADSLNVATPSEEEAAQLLLAAERDS